MIRLSLNRTFLATCLATIAILMGSTAFAADGLHGIGFVKGCLGPVNRGDPYNCSYGIFNNIDNGDTVISDTLTISSIIDVVHAFPADATSTNLLPLLTLHLNGGATCNPGHTLCTLPPGSSISADPFSFYNTDGDDPTPLSDSATLTWQDTCNSLAGNCPVGDQHSTSGSQVTLDKRTPSVVTTIKDAGNLTILTAQAGTTVHDTVVVSGGGPMPTGTVDFLFFTDASCIAGTTTAGSAIALAAGAANSNNEGPLSAGAYSFKAHYNGNAFYNAADGACEPLTITKNSPTIATLLSTTTALTGASVHDSSTITGATASAGGSVTYTAYTDNACSVGAMNAGTKAVTSGIVPDSNALVFPTAGTFYWQAVYSGDVANNGATSTCRSEILVVNKSAPTIATVLSSSSISVGSLAHDSSTLSGATATAGGSVTYTAYTDNACSVGAMNAGTKAVTSGIVPDSNALVFPTAGTFYWQAVYSGDANNAGATSPCQSEILTVTKRTPTIATILSSSTIPVGGFAHDTATLTGATANASGTVTYTVFQLSSCGLPLKDGGTKNVVNGIVPNSNTLQFTDASVVYWQASYSGDANNAAAVSPCMSEILTIAKNTPTITTTLSTTSTALPGMITDSAIITGATANASGTVTYKFYTNSICTLGEVNAGTKTVVNGIVPDSNAMSIPNAGTYYWVVTYSGDTSNAPATSACRSEIVTVNKATPQLVTTLSTTSIATSTPVHDTSILLNATANAGGTVTYTVYSNAACTAGATGAGVMNVVNGVVPNSNNLTFPISGTYYWQAVYSGDANNAPYTSPCTEEVLVVMIPQNICVPPAHQDGDMNSRHHFWIWHGNGYYDQNDRFHADDFAAWYDVNGVKHIDQCHCPCGNPVKCPFTGGNGGVLVTPPLATPVGPNWPLNGLLQFLNLRIR